MYHWKYWISSDEMITPTLPSASARMCRKMPAGQKHSHT